LHTCNSAASENTEGTIILNFSISTRMSPAAAGGFARFVVSFSLRASADATSTHVGTAAASEEAAQPTDKVRLSGRIFVASGRKKWYNKSMKTL
jgi:hypothetical protein